MIRVRILYLGQLSPDDSAEYRWWALLREGHEVEFINTLAYGAKQELLRKLEFRVSAGPEVARLNRDILAAADRFRPGAVWCDKVLWMEPATLDKLRARGIVTLSYYDELLAKVNRCLPDAAAGNAIALAGQRRAWSSGYDNDTQVWRIIARVQEIAAAHGERAA